MAVLRWSQQARVEWHYIAPGKLQQNVFIESFIHPCDETLDEALFRSLAHARLTIATWPPDFNTVARIRDLAG